MSKVTMFAAALAAVGVTLFTSSGVLAQPAPPETAVLEPTRAEVDRAVERHLGTLLQKKLADLRAERTRAMGLR